MRTMKVLGLVLLVVLMAVPLAGAQVGSWDSAFNVLNLGSSAASVSVTFYTDAGLAVPPTCLRYTGDPPTCDLPNPFTLDVGAKEEIFLAAMGDDLPDGRYSVVISADQPVAAIGSLVGNDSDNFYNGSYTGMADDGQLSMYLPGVMAGFYGWYSHISTQNLTGSAQDVSVVFYTEATNTVCVTEGPESVPAYSSWHLDVSTLDLSACDANGDGFNGAVVVTGAGPLAVLDNQTTNPPGYFEQTYGGFVSGADTLYAPYIFRGTYPPGNWDSSLNIQNVGAAAAHVTITFNPVAVTYEFDLEPFEGRLVYPPADVTDLPVSLWSNYSAVIETDGEPIVAIVNSANALGQAQTYHAVSVLDAGIGDTVAVPIVQRNYYGWDTSCTVQNLGTDAVVVNVSYSDNANPYGTPWTGVDYDTASIAAGQSLMLYQGNGDDGLFAATGERIPETYTGGAILSIVSGSGPIIAVVDTTNGPGQTGGIPGPGDWSTSFNAINP